MSRIVPVLALVSSIGAFAAYAQDGTFALICDQTAASPLDDSRPANIPGVPADKVDPKIAIPACEAAAREAPDDPRILFQLGRAYGAAKAYESARESYAKADAAGYALATNNLAVLYSDGLGVPADHARAQRLLEKAANAGLSIAMYSLGANYRDGFGVAKDFQLARQWFLRAAEAGHVAAMDSYALLLFRGEGGPKDIVAARHWFQKAAAAGNVLAMNTLDHNATGVARDYAEARRWYEKAAAAGDAIAMHNLGTLYAHGSGVARSHVQARLWYEKAANLGDAPAMNDPANRRTRTGRRSEDRGNYAPPSNPGLSNLLPALRASDGRMLTSIGP